MNETVLAPLSKETANMIEQLRSRIDKTNAIIRWLKENDERIVRSKCSPYVISDDRVGLFGRPFDVTPLEVASCWPDAQWERVDDGHTINYEAVMDGFTLFISQAEPMSVSKTSRTPLDLNPKP